MALRRPTLVGAGMVAATRPPARPTLYIPSRRHVVARAAGRYGRARAGAATTAWHRASTTTPVLLGGVTSDWRFQRSPVPQRFSGSFCSLCGVV